MKRVAYSILLVIGVVLLLYGPITGISRDVKAILATLFFCTLCVIQCLPHDTHRDNRVIR